MVHRLALASGGWLHFIRCWGMVLLAVVLLSAGVLVGCGTLPATFGTTETPAGSSSSAVDLQQDVIHVIHTVQPSVVEVSSTGPQGGAIGSGEVLTSDGYIVTNDHVVSGFTRFSVRFANSQVAPARLAGQDAQDDLAVLKVGVNHLQPISLGNSAKVQVGSFSVAVGNPLGLEGTATFGIVSALNRTASEGPGGPAAMLTGLIQTSAPINPGNSGGALVDLQGQLIGIPTLIAVDPEIGAPANGIGFAIPSNRVQFVTQQLIQYGKLTRSGQGFLGIQGQEVTPALATAQGLSTQSGVLIVGFVKDTAGQSPAQQAGLKAGDVITGVNGQTVTSSDELAALTVGQAPGTQIKVTAVRGKSQLTVTAKLGERPVTSQ